MNILYAQDKAVFDLNTKKLNIMLESKERNKIINRIGPMGEMVVDLACGLKFPIESHQDLARQFPENQIIVVGNDHFPAAQIALQIPEKIFPLKSFEDLVKKLEKVGLKEVDPTSLKKLVSQQPMIGFTLKRDVESLKRTAEGHVFEQGGPGDRPSKPSARHRKPKESDKGRAKMIERLGPLGDMVIELLENIYFPLKNPQELAEQFSEEEKLILGSSQIPIAQLALMLPETVFPMKSIEDIVDKLVESKIMEVDPGNLQFLLNRNAQVGLMLESDEKELRDRAKKFKMEQGGPDKTPEFFDNPPDREVQFPERAKIVDRLGPLGEIIYDLAEHRMNFPLRNPMELSGSFREKDFMLIGLNRVPLAKLALQTPENIFPIESMEDLIKKLEEAGFREVSNEQLLKYLNDGEFNIGYSIPYHEKELIKLARQFEMSTGSPDNALFE